MRHFEVVVNVGDEYIRILQKTHVTVSIDDVMVGEQDFTVRGYHTVRWDIPPAPPGPVRVTIRSEPEYHGERFLGIAVASFGFVP